MLRSATHRDRWSGSSPAEKNKTAPCRLPRPGGVGRSDRSDMGCSHTESCPLFPLLKASLSGWRDSYCDSEERWRECARYRLASRGQLVPISLLPNGADVGHIRAAAERSAAAEPTPPAPLISGSQGTVAWFEPAPAPKPSRPSQPPPPERRSPPPPSSRPSPPSQAPQQPPANPPERSTERRAPKRRAPKRRWWNRIAEWMRGPA